MIVNRNNHVFKGHKTLLGSKYVTYAEVELPTRFEIFPQSSNGFDWGSHGPASIQLAFSILYQLSNNEEIAKKNASKFSNEVIRGLNSRDWILNTSDVLRWINSNLDEEDKFTLQQQNLNENRNTKPIKKSKIKTNIVKMTCKELGITQKNLAEILEVPEGTVSSWAVKNEIPRLGRKAIEFYKLHKRNQQIVDSYKHFTSLLEKH